MTATPSPARGEVRAAEVLAELGRDWGIGHRHYERSFDFAASVLAALLALAPDAEGVAVMRDGSVLAVEDVSTRWEMAGMESDLILVDGDEHRPYHLTPPRREEQDRG